MHDSVNRTPAVENPQVVTKTAFYPAQNWTFRRNFAFLKKKHFSLGRVLSPIESPSGLKGDFFINSRYSFWTKASCEIDALIWAFISANHGSSHQSTFHRRATYIVTLTVYTYICLFIFKQNYAFQWRHFLVTQRVNSKRLNGTWIVVTWNVSRPGETGHRFQCFFFTRGPHERVYFGFCVFGLTQQMTQREKTNIYQYHILYKNVMQYGLHLFPSNCRFRQHSSSCTI